jgi:hypothetical protein
MARADLGDLGLIIDRLEARGWACRRPAGGAAAQTRSRWMDGA